MKFRAKKANHYKAVQWTQGEVKEFTENDVKDAIAKGWNTTEASVENMERKITSLVEKKRKEIDRDLIANVPYRTLTHEYDITRQSLIRHKDNHLPA